MSDFFMQREGKLIDGEPLGVLDVPMVDSHCAHGQHIQGGEVPPCTPEALFQFIRVGFNDEMVSRLKVQALVFFMVGPPIAYLALSQGVRVQVLPALSVLLITAWDIKIGHGVSPFGSLGCVETPNVPESIMAFYSCGGGHVR